MFVLYDILFSILSLGVLVLLAIYVGTLKPKIKKRPFRLRKRSCMHPGGKI